MRDLFVDTPVLLHAVGGEHPYRPDCRAIVTGAGAGDYLLHISAETVQEFLFHRLRVGAAAEAVAAVRAIRGLCAVHPLDEATLDRGIEQVEEHGMRGRDAFIAGTALQAGFAEIVTTDRGFIASPGLRVVRPAEVVG